MKIEVLDHGYVELIEAWGRGRVGGAFSDEAGDTSDYEVGIVEAARQSTQGAFRGWGEDAKLLGYLHDHEHATPFEFAGMVVEVQAPLFVFREWHRHRTQSYNEMSARYAPLPDLYYLPGADQTLGRVEAAAQSKNKQERGANTSAWDEEKMRGWLYSVATLYDNVEALYKNALAEGIPKELARIVMPVGHYSRMRASANLRCWLMFMTLRDSVLAQWEIREYAKALGRLLEATFPRTWALHARGRA